MTCFMSRVYEAPSQLHIVNNFCFYLASCQPNIAVMKKAHVAQLKADSESIQERIEKYKTVAKKLHSGNKAPTAHYQTEVAISAKSPDTGKLQARYLAAKAIQSSLTFGRNTADH